MRKNKRKYRRPLIFLLAFFLPGASVFSSPPEKSVYITAKKIYTADDKNPVIENGGLWIEGKKIKRIDNKAKPPKDVKVLDLKDRTIIPGLIDVHSYAGFHEENFNVPTEPTPWAPFRPADLRFGMFGQGPPPPPKVELHFQAADALIFVDPVFRKSLAEGVTVLKVAIPGEDLIGGRSVCVKLGAGASGFMIKNPAAAEFSLDVKENVMQRYGDLKKIFLDAIEYRKRWEKYEKDLKKYKTEKADKSKDVTPEPKEPKKDETQESVLEVLDKKVPLVIQASSVNQIQAALKIGEEFKVPVIILGGQEAYLLKRELAAAKVPVIVGPQTVLRKKGEKINIIRELVSQKVPVAFCSRSGGNSPYLIFQLAFAVQEGLPKNEALNCLTINAARILGLADKIGSLAPQKDADFVILSGDIFDLGAAVERVYVNGDLVYPSGHL